MGDPWNVLFAQGALGWGPVSVPPKRGWWQVLHLERLMLTHDLVSRIFTVKQGSLFVSLSNLHNITHVLRMRLPNFPCIPTENVLLVYTGLLLTLSFRAHDFVSIYFTSQLSFKVFCIGMEYLCKWIYNPCSPATVHYILSL